MEHDDTIIEELRAIVQHRISLTTADDDRLTAWFIRNGYPRSRICVTRTSAPQYLVAAERIIAARRPPPGHAPACAGDDG